MFLVFNSVAVAEPSQGVIRSHVESIKALEKFINFPGKGIFFIDADEVLFTWKVDKPNSKPKIIRLYDKLEKLLLNLRKCGHKVYIMTYNHKHVIESKLKLINLSKKSFNGIVACNMKGDLYKAKGVLFKKFLQGKTYDFTVFIDNFPLFVKDIEGVARANNIKLYSFLCTGYKKYYHAYVHYHLRSLQEKLRNSTKDSAVLLNRIQSSLRRYKINVRTFSEDFPDVETFKQHTADLIWPYLVYL